MKRNVLINLDHDIRPHAKRIALKRGVDVHYVINRALRVVFRMPDLEEDVPVVMDKDRGFMDPEFKKWILGGIELNKRYFTKEWYQQMRKEAPGLNYVTPKQFSVWLKDICLMNDWVIYKGQCKYGRWKMVGEREKLEKI